MTCGAPESETGPVAYGVTHLLPRSDDIASLHVSRSFALRLGVTPRDVFFGSRRHAGWAWLTERALAWPDRYRWRHWHGFDDVTDTLKVQLTPLEG
jgi:hypothetical protein